MAVDEVGTGQRVRIKHCIPGAKGWTGQILSRKGAKYEVRTDEPHFGTDVHLVKPKDLEPVTGSA
jgi:hypothetical protein